MEKRKMRDFGVFWSGFAFGWFVCFLGVILGGWAELRRGDADRTKNNTEATPRKL